MGCGTSRPAMTVEVVQKRDKEDYFIEPIQLEQTLIGEFDDTFHRAQTCLNQAILLNDNLSDAYEETRQALAEAKLSFTVELNLGISCDSFVLDLSRTGENFRPSYLEVIKLKNQPAVQQADQALCQAQQELLDALQRMAREGKPVNLQLIQGNFLQSETDFAFPELDAFNTAVAKLDDAMGRSYKVVTILRKAGHPGGKCLTCRVVKPLPPDPGTESEAILADVLMLPATLLETCMWPHSAMIKEGELSVLEKAQALVWSLKDTPAEYDLSHIHRLAVEALIEDELKQAGVKKLVEGISIALYKLTKGCIWVKGHCGLDHAAFHLMEVVADEVRYRYEANGMLKGYGLKSLVSMSASCEYEHNVKLDFQMAVNVEDKVGIYPFPECLSPKNLLIWSRLQEVLAAAKDALEQLPALRTEADEAINEARVFYELAPEAAAKARMSMMDAVKAARSVGTNLKLLMEAKTIFSTLSDNVRRVASELEQVAVALPKRLKTMLAEQRQDPAV